MTIGIGELARRTGLTQQAIRAWESRFGFPEPARTEGGRRQYAEVDVERVLRVLALRDSGTRLAAAIARVGSERDNGKPPSIYAELRRLHPHLEHRVLRRDALAAISRAIEDEAMARTSRPHVFGAFQREAHFRAVSRRWHEIARTASSCLVYADFRTAGPAEGGEPGTLVTVPLEPDAPMRREWALVVVAPAFSVVLAAWEIPHGERVPAGARTYETVFSFDPHAVATAADVCLTAARSSAAVDPDAVRRIADSVATEPTDLSGMDAVVVRAFDYLQRDSTG